MASTSPSALEFRESANKKHSSPLNFALRHGQLFVMAHTIRDAMHLLDGKNVLIFENDFFLSEEAEQKLGNLGVIISGPFNRPSQVLDYLTINSVDAVIMDVTLEPEEALPVVAVLDKSGIPFIFALSSNPNHDGRHFAGFILSGDDDDLAAISTALFCNRTKTH